ELSDDLNSVDMLVKTGNVMVDAILNSKLSVAERLHVRLNVKAVIPEGLPMSDVELCAVLGNLLDNAVEACAALPEGERFIRVYIGKFKGQFYLSVQNSAGSVRKSGGIYLSTKGNGENHGYGIFRIDRLVKKYGGYVNRQNEQGVFATEIMLRI
ncbi:MAG: ATP-binding protein, partial [Lachnospiraceae bacterium]|nr:ATP-binding protein [Lachnospiraceae bacterium]